MNPQVLLESLLTAGLAILAAAAFLTVLFTLVVLLAVVVGEDNQPRRERVAAGLACLLIVWIACAGVIWAGGQHYRYEFGPTDEPVEERYDRQTGERIS